MCQRLQRRYNTAGEGINKIKARSRSEVVSKQNVSELIDVSNVLDFERVYNNDDITVFQTINYA